MNIITKKFSGKLIAIEGIDGSGKTTLAQSLGDALRHAGHSVLVTKQPGGTELGKKIRTLIEETGGDIVHGAQYLLFAADRAEHIERVIKPALAQGAIVIVDRLTDSSVAYQGYGYGIDRGFIETVNTWTMGGLIPDCTLYVQVSPQDAAARITARGAPRSSFEKEGGAFLARVIQGFEVQCASNASCVVLDGNQSKEKVLEQAHAAVVGMLRYI